MKVSVFGLGYVGTVSIACLARDGHEVVGVDINPDKAAAIARGESPIVEPGLDELLRAGVSSGRISATTDANQAVLDTDISLVSVGTPAGPGGTPDLTGVQKVTEEIARAIALKGKEHTFVLRSTVPAGTLDRCAETLASLAPGIEVHVANNPEFLREGSSIADYDHPAFTVVGSRDKRAQEQVEELYRAIDAPVLAVEPAVAELTKVVANAWHATKITFANEIGRLAKAAGVDGRDVMDVFMRDTKLNISTTYLRPGFAYGGSCLPKDVAALIAQARAANVSVPLLASLPLSNRDVVDSATDLVLQAPGRKVAVLGLAFKANTDDLRESAAVSLVKRLLGEGCEVRIYDRDVLAARLVGANLRYIESYLPHFERLLAPSAGEALDGCDTAVVTYATPEFREALDAASPSVRVVDLCGLYREPPVGRECVGIAW